MVEGPQCRLKAEKLAVLRGQQIVAAAGPTLSAGELDKLVGATIGDVLSVGKECFLVLADRGTHVLRLHFGMSGSQQLRPACSAGPALPAGSRKQITLELTLTTDALQVFDSTTSVRTTGYMQTWQGRARRDVIEVGQLPRVARIPFSAGCSYPNIPDPCCVSISLGLLGLGQEDFDRQGVIELLQADGRPAYDSLMEQSSFPGVGNVIKVGAGSSHDGFAHRTVDAVCC